MGGVENVERGRRGKGCFRPSIDGGRERGRRVVSLGSVRSCRFEREEGTPVKNL